jgi:hypothetical protein
MKIKLYTSVDGVAAEFIDEVDVNEGIAVRFCYDNWPEEDRIRYEFDYQAPDHLRRPPFEIQRPDGSWFPWADTISRPVEDEDEDEDEGEPVVLDESVSCQRCKSHRVASVSGKCSDLGSFGLGSIDHDGSIPDEVGIGGGDYIEIDYCLDCGQLQGEWPLPVSPIERGEE